MDNGKIVLTQSGYDELQEEYARLIDTERPAVVARIDEARSHGDLSENEPYQEARRQQAQIEERIEELEEVLKNAEVVKSKSDGRIDVGSTVVVEREDTTQEYHIVGEHEADINAGKLSHSSPIGQALIGKTVGDEITVEIPAGQATFKITAIK